MASSSLINYSQSIKFNMHDRNRFHDLSEAYKSLAETARHNLFVIKDQQEKGALRRFLGKSPLQIMKPFNLTRVRNSLTSNEGEKPNTLILGEFDDKLSFYPSITEKILKIHGVANFVNAVLQTKILPDEKALVQPLQETLLDFYFLSTTFKYYAHHASLIDGKIENLTTKKAEREDLVQAHRGWFLSGLNDMLKPCLDLAHLNSKIKQYVFCGYSYMTYNVEENGKLVNDYFLPKEYWEPYLRYAAAEQAKAMMR